MTQWNRRTFGRKGPTDVIAFPFHEEDFLGSILISTDMAARQARHYQHPFSKEVTLLLIHGILHLLEYNHEKPKEAVRMKKMERKILQKIRS